MKNEQKTTKPVIFSGIKPSGDLTIGNYLGSIKNWTALQDNHECYFSIVDMHAITIRQEAQKLKERTLDILALYIASGLSVDTNIFFVQSHNPAHAELAWALSCYTQYGELTRMTQFKDYAEKQKENINGGLLMYPVLMAADILLYDANLVPVGVDQKQHIELTRNIAERFNHIYGETFVVPEPYIEKNSAKIYSLTEPTKKMSKSDTANENSYVLMLEEKDKIIKKFKRAVTDSESLVRFGEGKDGVNNLMSIYSCFTGKSYEDIEREFDGRGYGDFKTTVGEAAAEALMPVQNKYRELTADKAQLDHILSLGLEKAKDTAYTVLNRVYDKIGFYKKV